MSSKSSTGTAADQRKAKAQARAAEQRKRRIVWAAAVLVAVLAVGGLFAVFNRASTPTGKSAYQVGTPGVGQQAPAFDLASSSGGWISLAGLKGKTVLLYFQEGLTCQPCWDQMHDLEKVPDQVKAAGVDEVVSITSDPADLIKQKTTDMKLTTPVLSDPDLAVSNAYHANNYGMMGTSRDGHSFVLLGPDGTIRWRADYGGAPNYTMYVPPTQLLSDLRAGEHK